MDNDFWFSLLFAFIFFMLVILFIHYTFMMKSLRELRHMLMLLLSLESEKALKEDDVNSAPLSENIAEPDCRAEEAPNDGLALDTSPAPVTPFAAPIADIPQKQQSKSTRLWKWICVGDDADDSNLSAEYKAATTWLIRIGVVALLVGLGFLIKLSVEKGVFPPSVRIFGLICLGTAAAATGTLLAKGRFRSFWLSISGGGFALMMLALFGGCHIYALYSPLTAFILFVPVVVMTMAAAWFKDGLITAVIGSIGGFLSPLFLEGTESTTILALAWITLFHAAVLQTSYCKKWHFLRIFSLVLSFLMFAVFEDTLSDRLYGYYLAAVLLNFIFSAKQTFIRNSRITDDVPQLYFWHFVFSLASYFWLMLPVARETGVLYSFNCPALMVLAVMLPVAAAVVINRSSAAERDFFAVTFTLCSLFLGGHWLDEMWKIALVWNLLALLLCTAAIKLNSKKMLFGGTAFLELAFVYLMCMPYLPCDYLLQLLQRGVSFGVFGIVTVIVGTFWQKFRADDGKLSHPDFSRFLIFFGSIVLFFYTSYEVKSALSRYLPEFQWPGVSLWWAAAAFVLVSVGICKRISLMRKSAIFLFIITVLKVLFFDMEDVSDWWRIAAFCALGILLLLAAIVYIKRKELFQLENTQGKAK